MTKDRRGSVGALSTRTLQTISDYYNVAVAAILVVWVGTDLTARILSPFWISARDVVLPWSWSTAFLVVFALMYFGAISLQRLIDRRDENPS